VDPTIERLILGGRLKDLIQVPKAKQITQQLGQELLSEFPVRELGWSEIDGAVQLSEEDRESHVHILGSPGEGKSKFLELLLRQDIDNGYGACLLDPSDNGDTCYKVLKYAIQKGHKKIVLVDPHDISRFAYVPTINPIHYRAPSPAVVGGLMDAIRVLWGQGSFADTPRIQKYLPAVIAALHASEMTLAEARYFMDNSKVYEYRRNKILESLHDYDLHKRHIESAFKTQYTFEQFQSTVNRLQPFLDPTMELIFGAKEGLNFVDLVSQGYLVLVNLAPEGVFGQEHQRLLGTIIINEITYAISRLRNSGWKGVYYLYIDEAGDYATSKLSYILDKKRKSGLRLTLSHQRFDQFADKDVSSAVYGGTKIKVLFNTASREDRDKMIRMMYGGELSDRDVSYTLSQLRKQNAVIKINKMPPLSMRLQDVPDVQMPAKELAAWKEQHYKTNSWYRSTREVREEINHRFDQATTKAGRPYAPRPQHPVRPEGPGFDAPADSSQDRTGNQAPTSQGPPVEGERGSGRKRIPVQRKKGVHSSFLSKHNGGDEPVGE
jgi:hypothetical protein